MAKVYQAFPVKIVSHPFYK